MKVCPLGIVMGLFSPCKVKILHHIEDLVKFCKAWGLHAEIHNGEEGTVETVICHMPLSESGSWQKKAACLQCGSYQSLWHILTVSGY